VDTYDYVIVGAGSAGSVLANRLSEDGTASVFVLEAGPSDWHPYIHMPAGFIKTFHIPSVNWLYHMEPSQWTGGRRILAPRGKTLGGSSSINGHVYNRGQRMDFDTWAQLGNRGWGYADVLPYFRRMERRLGDGDPTFRGRDGSLTVSDLDWRHPLCEGLHRGRRQPRHPAQPRLQRRHPGGRRLRPHHQQRSPGQRRHRLPAPTRKRQADHGVHARTHRTDIRRQTLRRRRLCYGEPRR
jgi:choline dehydrogenase